MDKTNVQVEAKLTDIQEKAFYLVEPSPEMLKDLAQHLDVTVNTSIGHAPDLTQLAVRLDLNMVYRPKEESEKEVTLVTYEAILFFAVRGWDTDKNNPLVPHSLASGLAGTTYATVRGLLYARCGASVMRNYPLPLMQGDKLIKDLQGIDRRQENSAAFA